MTNVGTVFAALLASHYVADHWVQTSRQATEKALPGRRGRHACTAHVATYIATQAAALGLLAATGIALHPAWTAAGLAVSAITHWIADRRTPLDRLARAVGRGAYLDQIRVVRDWTANPDDSGPGTALFHLDQSWHIGWCFIAALVIA